MSLDYYRDAGFFPEALLNFLALMGFSFGGDREKFTLAEMIAAFDFAKVSAGEPVFDLQKLSWLNGLYLRDMPVPELLTRLRSLAAIRRLSAAAAFARAEAHGAHGPVHPGR